MNLGEDAERQRDILEEFEEHQQRYGRQQRELPEEGPDPNFDEPNRMPELDQGPDPVRRDVSLGDVKPTQSDISPVMGDGTPLEDITANMREEGWDATQPDPQMVQNDDGSLSTLDHRRLSAAEGAEIDEPATVHAPDEPIPEDQAERFQLKKKFTDPATGKEGRLSCDVGARRGWDARMRLEAPTGRVSQRSWSHRWCASTSWQRSKNR